MSKLVTAGMPATKQVPGQRKLNERNIRTLVSNIRLTIFFFGRPLYFILQKVTLMKIVQSQQFPR